MATCRGIDVSAGPARQLHWGKSEYGRQVGKHLTASPDTERSGSDMTHATGTPLPARKRPTTEDRFWAKVRPTGFCWEWIGGKNADGYGMIGLPKADGSGAWTKVSAHRYAYEALVGPIPPGLVIDHLCRNRGCVNPDHLEPVTVEENTLRSPMPTVRTSQSKRCVNGHPLSGENVKQTKRQRVCLACARQRGREWARKNRAAKAETQ